MYSKQGWCVQQQLSRLALLQVQEELHKAMLLNIRWLAELDVVISLATVCSEHHFVRPMLTSDNRLKIVKGWHPLSAALVSRFHPNDTAMHTDSQRVMIVTGPNCSGKVCTVI